MQTNRCLIKGAPLALLLAAVALPLPTFAEDTTSLRSISVAGEAERRVSPDMATLSMDVVTEAEDAAQARREADAVTARALALLQSAGIDESDIDTTGLAVNPQFRWVKEESRQELTSYQVSRSIEVRLLELDKLGELLIGLSESGVNRIQPPRLGLVNEESTYQEVLAAAAENARARAAVIASALGEELGAVISLSTEPSITPRPMAMERSMLAADMASKIAAESYSSAHLSYRVNITASFTLQ